jgi:hypothetical protein
MSYVARLTNGSWLAGCVAFMFICPIVYGGTMVEQRIEGGFAVTLPEGVTVSEESPVEDFILYQFKNSSGKTFLVAYLGNQPKALPRESKASRSSISGLPAEIVQWSDPSNAKYGGVRVRLQPEGWPSLIQFTYGPLDEADAALAKQISASVHRYRSGTAQK